MRRQPRRLFSCGSLLAACFFQPNTLVTVTLSCRPREGRLPPHRRGFPVLVPAAGGCKKSVKGLHLHLGQEAWGHVVAKLVSELPHSANVPSELVEKAKVLDNFYIPARYPNSHPEGAPFEHYGPLQSKEALTYAREILDFVRHQMA